MDQEHSVDQECQPAEDGDAGHGDDQRVRREQIDRAVAAFRQGVEKEQNFRRLYDTFYDPVRYFLAKRVSSREDCLDLTQETFLRVYRGLEGYRGDAQFGTWVFRIAYNTYLKWLRRLKIEEASSEASIRGSDEAEIAAWEYDERIAVSAERSPLEKTLRVERRQVLRRAIDELPDQMRRCTQLRIYQDLSYREIAVVIRRSIETVKVHLFQARKKLKDSFGELEL